MNKPTMLKAIESKIVVIKRYPFCCKKGHITNRLKKMEIHKTTYIMVSELFFHHGLKYRIAQYGTCIPQIHISPLQSLKPINKFASLFLKNLKDNL